MSMINLSNLEPLRPLDTAMPGESLLDTFILYFSTGLKSSPQKYVQKKIETKTPISLPFSHDECPCSDKCWSHLNWKKIWLCLYLNHLLGFYSFLVKNIVILKRLNLYTNVSESKVQPWHIAHALHWEQFKIHVFSQFHI